MIHGTRVSCFLSASRLVLLLLLLVACEKQPVAQQNAADDTAIRRMVENTAEKALSVSTGIGTRQLRIKAGAGKSQEKAGELVATAGKLGGTAITSSTPTGEASVLAQMPSAAVAQFCKDVTGSDVVSSAASPANGDSQLIEIVIEQ